MKHGSISVDMRTLKSNKHWSAENPSLIHEVPSCDFKIGVCCATSATRDNGPIPPLATPEIHNSMFNVYFETIFWTPVWLWDSISSEQDSPTAQSANNPSSCLQNVFGDEIGSFYWWGILKDKLCIVNICMEGDLKKRIQGAVFSVSPAEHQCVMSIFCESDAHLWAEENLFQYLLYVWHVKTWY